MKLLFLFSYGLLVAGALSPAEIRSRLDEQGGRKVLDALWENQPEWNQVLAGIESAEPKWLEIAQRLHPFSDAGSSEDLHNAVARALPKAPERILSLIGPGFEIEFMCTSPFIEPEPGVAEAYERQALAALASVRSPKLRPLAAKCAKLVKLPSHGA
jgi:hypothetical protein